MQTIVRSKLGGNGVPRFWICLKDSSRCVFRCFYEPVAAGHVQKAREDEVEHNGIRCLDGKKCKQDRERDARPELKTRPSPAATHQLCIPGGAVMTPAQNA